ALIASGGFLKLEAIWILADIVNGLMAIPNLIALIALSGVVVAETESYLARKGVSDEDKINPSAITE
ncbi:MAG: sodium:alanine symporter family protein, partial [Selenomonas sp.]|nr:sodium:alanine symporter family protein [Selenomonas sp.]